MEVKSLSGRARSNFITKVYSIVGIQLLLTSIFVYLSILVEQFSLFLMQNIHLFYLSSIVAVVTLLLLSFTKMSQQVPTNYALLGVFTLCESYCVATICQMYTPESVLAAAMATLAVTLGITLYAFTTQTDFTSWIHFLYGGFSGMFFLMMGLTFISIFFGRIQQVNLVISLFFGGIYCVYLLIDTYLLIGNGKYAITTDSYIMMSCVLYIDIISLFLKILRILGKKKKP